MFSKWRARKDQDELSNQKDKSIPHDFQKSQMVATPCANVKPPHAVGGGGLLQALGPPTIRFSQSSEKLKMQLEFDWPFF